METTIASLAVTVAKLQVMLEAHLKWHDQIMYVVIAPILVGVVITLINHWTLKKFISNGGKHNARP